MDYGAFTGMPAGGGIGAGIGAMAMIPKLTRGVMRRNVDYSSSIITHLEVSSFVYVYTLHMS